MANSITDDLLYLVIFTNDAADDEAVEVLEELARMTEDNLRIELVPIIVTAKEWDQMAHIMSRVSDKIGDKSDQLCSTGLEVKANRIVAVPEADVTFFIAPACMGGDEEASGIAAMLVTLLCNGQLGYAYATHSEEYPFDPESDMEEVFAGNERTYFGVPYKIYFVDGRFVLPKDEDDQEETPDDATEKLWN